MSGLIRNQVQAVRTALDGVGPRRLSRWFRGGVAGKKIAFVGDSTTLQLFTGGALSTSGLASVAVPPRHAAELPNVTLLNFGANGNTLSLFNTGSPAGKAIADVVAAAPDLIVFSYGINDVRQGATTTAQLVQRIQFAVETITAALPSADVVLRMPNSFLTTDVGATGYVVPNASAQAYSNILRDAYRQVADRWPHVAVYDSQKNVFDETSHAQADALFMTDQIHPNTLGYQLMVDQMVQAFIGAGAVERADNGFNLVNPAMFRVGMPRQYNAGRAREAIAKVGYRLAPTYYPEIVFGPDYELVVAGAINNNVDASTQFPTIAVFFAQDGYFEPQMASGELRQDDVWIQAADSGALTAAFMLQNNGGIKNTTALTMNAAAFSGVAPSALSTQAAGRPIAVYRNKYAGSATAKAIALQAQYTARAVLRVTSSGNGFVELSTWGASQDSKWTPRAGDVLSFQDIGDVTLTAAMTLTGNASGDQWRINQAGTNFTTLSTLCQIAGTGPLRAETNQAQPLRFDLDGAVATATYKRIVSRTARYRTMYALLETPDAANPTTVELWTTLNAVPTKVATVSFAANSSAATVAYVFSNNLPVIPGVPLELRVTSGGAGVKGLHLAFEQ